MLPNQGIEQTRGKGSTSSETSGHHEPEPPLCTSSSAPPCGGRGTVGSSLASSSGTNTSTSTHGEINPSRTEDLDPHICKVWPCPQCHKPRDAPDTTGERENIVAVQQHSAMAIRPAASVRSTTIFHSDPEPQRVEHSESGEDAATGAQGQSQRDHC